MQQPISEILNAVLERQAELVLKSIRMCDVPQEERPAFDRVLASELRIAKEAIDWRSSKDAASAVREWLPRNTYGNTIEDIWWRLRCLVILCSTPPSQVRCEWKAPPGDVDAGPSVYVDWIEFWSDIQAACCSDIALGNFEAWATAARDFRTWGDVAWHMFDNPACALIPWERASKPDIDGMSLAEEALRIVDTASQDFAGFRSKAL